MDKHLSLSTLLILTSLILAGCGGGVYALPTTDAQPGGSTGTGGAGTDGAATAGGSGGREPTAEPAPAVLGPAVTAEPDGLTPITAANAAQAVEAATMPGRTPWTTDAAWSPDGRYMVVTSEQDSFDQVLRVWDAATGDELAAIPLPNAVNHRFVEFTPQGTYFATARVGGDLFIWELATGEVVHRLTRYFNGGGVYITVNDMAISPDGALIVGGWSDSLDELPSHLMLFDVLTGEKVRAFEVNQTVESVAFHPDGSIIAAGLEDSVFRLFDVASGEVVGEYQATTDTITALEYSPDGSRLAVVGLNGSVWIVDAANGAEIAVLRESGPRLRTIAYSPDGTVIAGGDDDGAVLLWDASTGVLLATIQIAGIDGSTQHRVTSVAWKPTGSMLAVTVSDGTVRLIRMP